MFGTIVAFVVGLVLVVSALATVVIVGMRTKSRLVQGPIVWFSRRFMNPRQLRVAGQPGAYASIVRHRGRRSGRPYETPVGVVADGPSFLIALPYGSRAQWVRNVAAAGSATLVTEGETVAVDRPEVVETRDVIERFSASDQRLFRIFATDECLRVHRSSVVAARETLSDVAA